MGYMKIPNLYKDQRILQFRECYALEKVHGTSAHISYSQEKGFHLYSGGEKMVNFELALEGSPFREKIPEFGFQKVVFFGEAYGGKQQGMRETYGDAPAFTVFDVRINETWCSVPQAEMFTLRAGLEFMPYQLVPTSLEAIDAERDRESIVAIWRCTGRGKKREGVVLKPPFEVTLNNGGRIIAKHKRDDFRETKSPRVVGEAAVILRQAEAIADEWVTPMRLTHVLQQVPYATGPEHTIDIIRAMAADIEAESAGEIEWSKAARKAIGNATASMWKQRLKDNLRA